MAKILKKRHIITWDKCKRAHKHTLEALNRALKDLIGNGRLFRGVLIILFGNFW